MAVALAYRREMGEKRLISAGFIGWRRSPLRHIAKGSICSGAGLSPSLRRRAHGRSHFAVSDVGVTTAFYKVRDSTAREDARPRALPPPASPPFNPRVFAAALRPATSSVSSRAIVSGAVAMRFNSRSRHDHRDESHPLARKSGHPPCLPTI